MASNTAEQAALAALLDSSTHHQAPLTHASHHPTNTGPPQPFQSLSDPHPQPFQALFYLRFRLFRRFFSRLFSTECGRGSRSGEARRHICISQRVLSPTVEQGTIEKLSSICTRSCNNLAITPKSTYFFVKVGSSFRVVVIFNRFRKIVKYSSILLIDRLHDSEFSCHITSHASHADGTRRRGTMRFCRIELFV